MSERVVSFVNFVNKNIGKPLTTATITDSTRISRRTVQTYCKSVRDNHGWKVKVGAREKQRTLLYTFKKPIRIQDVTA